MDASLMAHLGEYVYSPLTSATSVRYIKLLPGLDDDAINCEIFEASTDESVPYTALSYSWGPVSDPKTIRCSDTYYLAVQSNLYQALWHIRHPVESRIMWIDAICINQRDVFERNHQVAQMTKIYTQAEKLLIWLGIEGHETAVEVITRYAKIVENHEQPEGFGEQPPMRRRDWQALDMYLDATWFRRVWVIQELVLGLQLEGPFATEVLCGLHSVTWKDLSRCLGYLKKHWTELNTEPVGSMVVSSVWRGINRFKYLQDVANHRPTHSQTEYDWMEWLVTKLPEIRKKECSDPRDRIFGLYGLCCTIPQPLPDYTLTASEVYRRFTVDAIRSTQALTILDKIENSGSPEIDVPSWVPDWTVRLETPKFAFPKKNFLSCVGLSRIPDNVQVSDINTPLSPGVLHLTGFILDEIIYVGTYPQRGVLTSWLQTEWYSLLAWKSTVDGEPTDMKCRRQSYADIPKICTEETGESEKKRSRHVSTGNATVGLWQDDRSGATEPVFTRFIHTIIAFNHVPGLDELISDGEDVLFELLNHTAQNRAVPLRSSLNKDTHSPSRNALESIIINNERPSPDVQTTRTSNDQTSRIFPGPAAAIKDTPRLHEDKFSIATKGLLHHIDRATHSRFFVTRKGYMGLGVRSIALGDQVAVLSTCGNVERTLFCIRPKETGFEFVGGAYIHEMNFDGEIELHWEKIDLV